MTSRPSVSRRRHVAAVALALPLLLTSCNTGGSPPGDAPASESPSPSATFTPAAVPSPIPSPSYKPADASGKAQNVPVPVLPEAAKAETKEGLEAFARYWFAQLNFAYETGQIVGLTSVTASSCQYCSNITGAVVTNYERDRWMAGGHIETPSISTTYKPQADGQYQVVVQVQQEDITYFDSDGTQFRSSTPPSDTGNLMLVVFRQGQWQLTGLHPIR